MNFDAGTWWVALLIIGGITSSLTYLIKIALFGRVDKIEEKIHKYDRLHVYKTEHDKEIIEIKEDIKCIKKDYTTKATHLKDFDECRVDIKRIKEDYITKEDFFREQNKTERKLDKIMDILLEMKGDKGERKRDV